MNFLKNIFKKKEDHIVTYEDFWNWFQIDQQRFFDVVKQKGNIEKDFFNKLAPKLKELKDGFFFLTGMTNPDTVELVITADGEIKNFVFVEELINAAPQIVGWKFTALKPAMEKDFAIKMSGYEFSDKNISFYSNENVAYPDEIDISIVHEDFHTEIEAMIINGVYIFLENYLGELESATSIDNLRIIGKTDAEKELVPISKLKSFLNWRQKEFIEKYEGIRHDTENDTYSAISADLENGNKLIAIINTDVLNWENKSSHPWILNVEIGYDGKNNNGMPNDIIYKLLGEIEDKILEELKDYEGFINIGRQTADNVREIYFACNDFRKPSRVLQNVKDAYSSKIKVNYNIYKDKYWQSFDRFNKPY